MAFSQGVGLYSLLVTQVVAVLCIHTLHSLNSRLVLQLQLLNLTCSHKLGSQWDRFFSGGYGGEIEHGNDFIGRK